MCAKIIVHGQEIMPAFINYPMPDIRFKCFALCSAGCVATVAALSFGLLQFKRGNTKRSQLAMRARVVAQGGTVIALVVGVLWTSGRKK